MQTKNHKDRFLALGSLIALLIGLLIVVFVVTEILKIIPANYSKFIDAAIIAIISYVVVRIVLTYIRRVLGKFLDQSTLHPIIFMVRMVGYFIIALAVVASFGINVSSIILGSTFLAAVIGLASQSVLANQFSGLLLIITRPFKIGDRVWIHAWQFSIMYAVIAPKYFSSDFLYNNGFVGKVKDISINYTTLVTDGGEVVKIANNVLTQSAYRITSKTPVVQVRYEIPKYLRFELVKDEILAGLKQMAELRGSPFLAIDETTLNTYVILVRGEFSTTDPSIIRGKIIEMLISTVETKRMPNN
ncbi:MAG: mechanosensitive ion channel family protein [Candidatus Thermoplasmatota archaeon]|nr:mechanosensitive ion channel family protein [Candidatus Thermoplasmatota archaeon]MCL5888878.1 mechanosensitive ion channel family protein [Candidatus Thermoplasmatota archaeon]